MSGVDDIWTKPIGPVDFSRFQPNIERVFPDLTVQQAGRVKAITFYNRRSIEFLNPEIRSNQQKKR